MKQTLFEYDKWEKVENSSTLFHSLKTIWRQRNFVDLTEELEENQYYYWNESIINWEIKTKE